LVEHASHLLLRGLLRFDAHGVSVLARDQRPHRDKEIFSYVLVISPEGRDGSAAIHQDEDIYRIRLKPGQTVTQNYLGINQRRLLGIFARHCG
jgi:hypothetical protein